MRSTLLYALATLNALLLCMFVARLLPDNHANAQVRRPGEYLLVPGEVSGASAGLVYVLDQSNQALGAFAFDENAKSMTAMPPIDLARVFQTGRR